jgi:hypothetical protein
MLNAAARRSQETVRVLVLVGIPLPTRPAMNLFLATWMRATPRHVPARRPHRRRSRDGAAASTPRAVEQASLPAVPAPSRRAG